MFSQNISDGGQFFIKRVCPFSQFRQGIQQVLQGKHIFGDRPFSTVVRNPAIWRTKPGDASFRGRVNNQRLAAGVTFGISWKVTFLGWSGHRLKCNTCYKITGKSLNYFICFCTLLSRFLGQRGCPWNPPNRKAIISMKLLAKRIWWWPLTIVGKGLVSTIYFYTAPRPQQT